MKRRVDRGVVARRQVTWPLAASLVVSAIALLGGPRVASACKCAPPPPPREAMNESHAVFEGKLVGQTALTRQLVDLDSEDAVERVEVPIHVATFEILAVWKGDGLKVGDTVEIETSASSASCGRDYTYATEWVIYANSTSSEGGAEASASNVEGSRRRFGDMACTRSGPSDAANGDGDVAALDAITPQIGAPATAGAPPETEASREGCSVIHPGSDLPGSAGLLAIALACLWLPVGRASRKSRP